MRVLIDLTNTTDVALTQQIEDKLPRELMMEWFNRDLTNNAYRNMMNRTTKDVGTHGCWLFRGALTTQDLSRGPKPRQSVQYRLHRGQSTPLPKKALDGHLLAMIRCRMRSGLRPWARGDTVSSLPSWTMCPVKSSESRVDGISTT